MIFLITLFLGKYGILLHYTSTITTTTTTICGPGSVIGIATGYGLDGPGARFSAPVQTGPGTHPASCTMGTGSFPGVKSG